MAVAVVEHLTFTYASGRPPALEDLSLELADGEHVVVLGPSGSGKSTLLRALAGLVPHLHGGVFAGRVVVGGVDTREARPAELAGTVASVFQDPEDQIVMSRVANEVAFGLENVGPSRPRSGRVSRRRSRSSAPSTSPSGRCTDLSGGELQRVSLAAAVALRPRLLLLDEPTSQLDPDGAEAFLAAVRRLDCAVLLSEQRPARPLERADRVLFLEQGRLRLDAPREEAVAWLRSNRPLYLPHTPELACGLAGIRFSYGDRRCSPARRSRCGAARWSG